MPQLQSGSVFINYRRDDSADEARMMARVFQEAWGEGEVFYFDQQSVQLTEDWRKTLREALERAEVMISLIGPKWIASFAERHADQPSEAITDWVQFEIETALTECIDIVPIFLKDSKVPEPSELPDSLPPGVASILRRQGFVMKAGEFESTTRNLIDSLTALLGRDAAKSLHSRPVKQLPPLASLPLDTSYDGRIYELDEPFLGPAYFTPDHAALFFGRDKEIRHLFHLVRRNRLILLNGYSGSGKSSLLHAGLIPRMKSAAQARWKVCAPIRRNKQEKGLARQLEQLKDALPLEPGKKTLIILDQVEEMYTDPFPREEEVEEIAHLGRLLKEILESEPRVHVLLAFRSEFERKFSKEFIREYSLFDILDDMYLSAMDEAGIVQAIRGPAKFKQNFRYDVTKPVAAEIARDFVGEDFSPHAILLQIQLVKLWQEAKKQADAQDAREITFTAELYHQHQLSEVTKFIQDALAKIKTQPRWAEAIDLGLGLDVLYSFTTAMGTATGYEDALFIRFYQKDGIDPEEFLHAFKRAYLLATPNRHNKTSRLAHDSLAPVIRQLYHDSDAPGQRAQRIVETKLREIEQGFQPNFSETDIDTLLAGVAGMRQLPEALHVQMQADQQRYRAQKEERMRLALNNAAADIEHLRFKQALDNLLVARGEGIRPERVLALARYLPFPLLELGQEQALDGCLELIRSLTIRYEDLRPLLSSQGPQLRQRFQTEYPRLYQHMEQAFFPELVEVPGGQYAMGSEEGATYFNQEGPVHTVEVDGFRIAATPVTCRQYGIYCLETGRDLPRDSGFGRGDRPVVNINWYEATHYCNWLSAREDLEPVYEHPDEQTATARWEQNGYRLPTEAEWEYAARERGKDVRFGNGKQVANPEEMNFDGQHVQNRHNAEIESWHIPGKMRGETTPGRRFTPNALGLYDMSGNVYEWCWDGYDEAYYGTSPEKNPRGPVEKQSYQVVRGGSWLDTAIHCRCSARGGSDPMVQGHIVGFRVVRR